MRISSHRVQLLEYWLSVLAILGVSVLLILALVLQFFFNELPCPLCLLQRIGFLVVAIGFVLNLQEGLRPSHYSMVLLGGLFTAFVALRQIVLHILPGTGGYGTTILGFHLYTWSFILAMLVVIMTAVLQGFDTQYAEPSVKSKRLQQVTPWLVGLVWSLAVINFVSTIAECGLTICPDNPRHYVY